MATATEKLALPGGSNTSVPVIEKDVAVFSEGTITTLSGKEVSVDRAFIEEVAKNNNDRVADTGDMVPLIVGHTSEEPDADEKPVIGFAKNFRVGKIGNLKPRFALLADFLFRSEDDHETARRFPRRSVEIWSKSKLIDPIALLGGTRPHFDLGLLGKSTSDEKIRLQFQLPSEDIAENHMPSVADLSLEELQQFIVETVAGMKTEEEKPADDQLSEEEAAKEQEEESSDEGVEEEKEQEQLQASEQDKIRLQRDQARDELAKLQAERDADKQKLDDLLMRFKKTDREKDLVQLRHRGFSFDITEELDYCLRMSDEQYSKHLEMIEKRYQKAPVGSVIPTAALQSAETADTEAQVKLSNDARDLAIKEGISYQEAKAKLSA